MTALDTDVLIVGAGPTSLTLALRLRKLGVDVRIIDERSAPEQTSRALAVQSRTVLAFDRLERLRDQQRIRILRRVLP